MRNWYAAVLLSAIVAAVGWACSEKPVESPPQARQAPEKVARQSDEKSVEKPAAPSQGSKNALDEFNGFHDLKFGSGVAEGMKLVEETEFTKTYVRPGDDIKIGEGKLDDVRYVYHDGRLTSVTSQAKGLDAARAVRDGLQRMYGPSDQRDPSALMHFWRGKRVVASYMEDPIARTANVVVWSVEMMEPLAEKLQPEKDEKAGSGDGE